GRGNRTPGRSAENIGCISRQSGTQSQGLHEFKDRDFKSGLLHLNGKGDAGLPICSPAITRVSVSAGSPVNCQAAPGMRGRYAYSGPNSSPFGLIWMTDAHMTEVNEIHKLQC